MFMMIENNEIFMCIYPASRGLFDLPRSVAKRKRLDCSRKIEETSARRVIVYRYKPDLGVGCESWFILVIL